MVLFVNKWSRCSRHQLVNTFLCYWCSVECSSPLGLENRSIPDSALTASSAESCCPANQARLNNKEAWPPSNVRGAWLQVEFKNTTNVTAIATQGRPDSDIWVRYYYLYHSIDGQIFQPHQRVRQVRWVRKGRSLYSFVWSFMDDVIGLKSP